MMVLKAELKSINRILTQEDPAHILLTDCKCKRKGGCWRC